MKIHLIRSYKCSQSYLRVKTSIILGMFGFFITSFLPQVFLLVLAFLSLLAFLNESQNQYQSFRDLEIIIFAQALVRLTIKSVNTFK